ncbi:hypothetical protein [Bacillus sp. 1P02SD]|uniref:hypothetical protein n=1 Tax=Bacillus sp. 1P02SD TaxID=3132264 RepID=UPI00399F1D80
MEEKTNPVVIVKVRQEGCDEEMNPIDQINTIIANQKTVSTTKLVPIVKAFAKMYINTVQKMNNQKNTINELNKKYQQAKHKADKRLEVVEQYERLKIHHRNLEREYNLLLEKMGK